MQPSGQMPDKVAADFEGEYGDRRQEIVIIGISMDKEAICSLLDSCLVTDEEMEEYKKKYDDTATN